MDTLTKLQFDGTKLQAIRKTLGLKQKEVAEKIGVEKQTLSNYECKKGKPSADVMTRLFILYGISDANDIAFEQHNL